jgi:hypothetical protein
MLLMLVIVMVMMLNVVMLIVMMKILIIIVTVVMTIVMIDLVLYNLTYYFFANFCLFVCFVVVRCVGSGAWTRENFFEWMTSYLQWMWFGSNSANSSSNSSGGTDREGSEDVSNRLNNNNNNNNNSSGSKGSNAGGCTSGGSNGGASLESMVLSTLTLLLHYDAVLAMSVLTGIRSTHLPMTSNTTAVNNSLDGSPNRGDVSFREVISYLQGITSMGNELTSSSKEGWSICQAATGGDSGIRCPMALIPLPLTNGHALSVAYAEWVVDQLTNASNSGNYAPSSGVTSIAAIGGKSVITDILEEYAQILMTGLQSYLETDQISQLNHSKNDLSFQSIDTQDMRLFKIYRSKLQAFLQCEKYEYRPERMMKYLPQGLLHEYALLLSRLGSHDEVLTIYIHQLGESDAAEAYCDRMHAQSTKRDQLNSNVFNPPSSISTSNNVYLSLIKAKLDLAVRVSSYEKDPVTSGEALQLALQVAEKYFDRVDPSAVLDLLPPKSPVATVCYNDIIVTSFVHVLFVFYLFIFV